MNRTDEFVFDGTEESLPYGCELIPDNEIFWLPGLNVPITNRVGPITCLTPGKRYYVLRSGRIVEAR